METIEREVGKFLSLKHYGFRYIPNSEVPQYLYAIAQRHNVPYEQVKRIYDEFEQQWQELDDFCSMVL